MLHRFSPILVSKLVKEAELAPEKRAERRLRKQLLEDKKDAVEEVTTNFLNANVPIVRAQQVQLAVEEQMGLEEICSCIYRPIFRSKINFDVVQTDSSPKPEDYN